MKKKNIVFIIVFNLLIAAGIMIYIELTRTKTYYIDLQKVYSEFELKKELEVKLQTMLSIGNQQLDSLKIQAQTMGNEIQQGANDEGTMKEYNMLAQIYTNKSEAFAAQQKQMAEEYDQQIWGQLNEYVKLYGKEKNCDFIIAGNGDGSIMYARETKDITDKMIVYVNEKYQGK